MNMLCKSLVCASVFALSLSSIAGGVVAVASNNSLPTGLYAGIGGGYNSLSNEYKNTELLGESFENFSASSNGLAPLVQLGFRGKLGGNMTWGVKATYSYLNILESTNRYLKKISMQLQSQHLPGFWLLPLLHGRRHPPHLK